VYYWASCVECYFSPWADLISGDEEMEGTGVALAELLDELQVEEKEIVTVTTVSGCQPVRSPRWSVSK